MAISLDEEEVTRIIRHFITTYVENSHNTDVVLGLSGGIDSAFVARLCSDALGGEHVHCLIMPDTATPAEDLKHAQDYAILLGVDYTIVDITRLVASYQDALGGKATLGSLANIKARIRMTILYEYANRHHALVCGTSNKSELLIGYFTKYGDGGVDFHPIGDLYKTQIYQLSDYHDLPSYFFTKKPTAGLIPGQTDEQELGMEYATLDRILIGLESKRPLESIATSLELETDDVESISKLYKNSRHKRHLPLIVKLGGRTIGIDWRTPLQDG